MSEQLKVTRLTSLKEDEAVFESKGISRVKVTRAGIVEVIEVPVRSTGVSELVDAFSRNAPKPPLVNELVEPDSEIGRAQGLTKKKWIKIPNIADEDYLRKKEKHDSDLGIAVMCQGLDLEITDREGHVATTDDEKVRILKQTGMTAEQFVQIIKDIRELTEWSEEQQTDFFAQS
jgi:hypothetical protein